MKLKTQEKIRTATIISLLLLTLITNDSICKTELNEIIKFLDRNGIGIDDLEELKKIVHHIFNLDILTSFYTQTKTDEYKELKFLYDQVIENTADLSKEFEFNDPVEIFAMYVYLYRGGYLSYNKRFFYGTDMKDFAKLGGIDVVRGTGVCRSISSFLTDLYLSLDFNANNLSVNATSNSIKNQQNLSSAKLNVEEESKIFAKIVSALTKFMPLANHQITMVSNENNNYIFDPTNDGYLKKGKCNKLEVSDYDKSYMKLISWEQLMMRFMGITKVSSNINSLYKDLNKPSIDDREYRKTYLSTLKTIKQNIDLLDWFYYENKKIYKDIYDISKEQNDMIRRIFPIIPKVKTQEFRRLK